MPKEPGTPLQRPIEPADLMLATLHRRPFNDPDWLFEWKYDGYRCLVRKAGGLVELLTRNGNSLNASFPDVEQAVAEVPGSFTWDSELTVDTDGMPSFERLQIRAKTTANVKGAARKHPARLYVLDMMSSGKRDLRTLPLDARKQILRGSFEDTARLVYATGIVGAGVAVFDLVKQYGFEGMVAKRMSSTYQKGRSRDWLKIKWTEYSRHPALGFGNAKTNQTL
jgi:bifunctional non-homologous end joining protein LigD